MAELDDATADGAEGCRNNLPGVRSRVGFPEAILGAEEEGPGCRFGRFGVVGEEFGAGVDGQEVGQEGELKMGSLSFRRLRGGSQRQNGICRVKEGLYIGKGA
jgi:hypothetical protein